MKPKLLTTVTETTEVELSPAVKEHLAGILDTYDELCFQIDALEHQRNIEKQAVEGLMKEHGLKSFRLNNRPVSIVEGTTSKLDEKKLLALGVTLAQIEMATVVKPKKPYISIGKIGKAKEDGD